MVLAYAIARAKHEEDRVPVTVWLFCRNILAHQLLPPRTQTGDAASTIPPPSNNCFSSGDKFAKNLRGNQR